MGQIKLHFAPKLDGAATASDTSVQKISEKKTKNMQSFKRAVVKKSFTSPWKKMKAGNFTGKLIKSVAEMSSFSTHRQSK